MNPDDYYNLLKELKKYNEKPVLLKEVGLFKAAEDGSTMVFDLGGNAAEWVEIEEGKGKACGGSAEQPVDVKSKIKPQPGYIGFRVVLITGGDS